MHNIINFWCKNKKIILLSSLIIILIICIWILLFILILILIVAYTIFKINSFSQTGNFIEMKDYCENTKKCLEKYGDYKIKQFYLVKTTTNTQIMGTIIKYITLFKYNELIKKAKYFHTENILVVKRGKDTKILILHKCPNIILSDKVIFIKENKLQKIPICSTDISVNELLTSVKKNMGLKFFNWNLIDNNCQHFSKEIIHILKKYNKTYIKDDGITKVYKQNNYTIYDIYILNVTSVFFIFCFNNRIINHLLLFFNV